VRILVIDVGGTHVKALAILRRGERMQTASDLPKKGLEFPREVRLRVTPEGGET